FTSNPSRQHWKAITRVFKYLRGTKDYSLSYVGYPSVLEGYSDASWINHVEDSSSTSGWVFLLGGGAISWASKKQTCITSSTMESEFVALAAAGKEAEWLRNLIHEIPIWPKPIAPISIRCDSAPTMARAYSQIYNGKSRHLGVRHSMVRELIRNGVISIEFVRTQHNLADHLTKGLARDLRLEHVYLSSRGARSKGTTYGSVTYVSSGSESQASKKTQSFLKDVSHLKLSYQELESATDNFAKENILNENRLIIKGRLLCSEQYIDIFVKGYNSDSKKDESKMFRVELSMLSSLKHKNLVSLIGFMDEAEVDVKAIIYKREANGSLKKYLSDDTLTWMQRLKICTDVSKALSYIHYDVGRDFSVIHCNIRSSKILLDDQWEPKLSGFNLSLKNPVARRDRLVLSRDIIENAYLDPKYKKTGGMTHKSDVYSFGVVLFEVLCGMSAIDEDEDEDEEEEDDESGEGLLSKLAKCHLDDMIMPQLRKQMDLKSFKIFSETAYWCIKEDRADRPYIDQVVKRLEKALKHQRKYENPVNLTPSNQFETAFNAMKLQDNATDNWNMDICASSHLNDSVHSRSDVLNMCIYPSVLVGDGYSIPVTNSGHSILPTPHRPLHLNNVLITLNIVKNLIYIRQFVRDNNCTVEFDAFGFSIKDFMTRRVLLRYDNTGDLYRCEMKSFQCDHGDEFDNHAFHKLFADNGIQLRFSCPCTSQQNGKCERIIHTINNIIRT
ncbi:kinase-like domain, phloem protein 2-like protein, partial [Tanacetum coccineum]